MINNIKNNTTSEADTIKKITKLNKIKNTEIKGKRLINSQEKLLSLFDDLKTILNNNNNGNNNESNSNNKNENVNENENENENENVNENENENENENVNENENMNENENENENVNENENENVNENENMNENENESDDEQCYEIKQLNDWFKTTDQAKSLEEQIEMLKTIGALDGYWYVRYYHGNKELNYKIFKAKAAHLLNDLHEQLFEKIFGYTFAGLVDKLINTIDKKKRSNNY